MIGTEKQIAYATKMRPQAIRVMDAIAEEFAQAVEDGLSPELAAQADVIADLVATVQRLAAEVKTTEDAAFILDHKDANLAQIIQANGFVERLTAQNKHTLSHF